MHGENMKKIYALLMFAFALTALNAFAGENCETPPYVGSKEFEKMKTLAGKWEGSAPMGDKDMPVVVEYKVTGNGSTVVETLSPGTPQEMVSVYYDRDGRLAMTHYCALGNRPQMILKKSDGENEIHLDYTTSQGINPRKDMHMHSLSVIFVDQDHIKAAWTSYDKGKSAGTHSFALARSK
jgi:hypothetical protein